MNGHDYELFELVKLLHIGTENESTENLKKKESSGNNNHKDSITEFSSNFPTFSLQYNAPQPTQIVLATSGGYVGHEFMAFYLSNGWFLAFFFSKI